MDIDEMREFVRLSECRSFTTVAREFYVSQPTVTKHIQGIEHSLGTKLVRRDSHSLTLTEAGECAAESFSKMLDEYDLLCEKVDALGRGQRGELRIGVLYLGIDELVRPYVETFRERCPNVCVSFASFQNYQVLDAMDAGTIDVGVASDLNPRVADYGFKPVLRPKFMVCASSEGPLAGLDAARPDDLRGMTLLAIDREGVDFAKLARMLGCSGTRNAEQVDMVSMDLRSDVNAIAICDEVLTNKLGDGLVYVPLLGLPFDHRYGYVYRKDDSREMVSRFLDCIPELDE